VLFNKRDPKLVQPKPCKGAETDSRGKFGKETIAGAYMRPKWVLYYDSQADSRAAQDAQALLRLCSGCSPLAQVKAAAAHVQGLKRNRRGWD